MNLDDFKTAIELLDLKGHEDYELRVSIMKSEGYWLISLLNPYDEIVDYFKVE